MIRLENVTISYGKRTIIKPCSFDIPEGKITMILGLSGSGKSTLLYRIGLCNESREFDYFVDGINISKLSYRERQKFVADNISFVLQTKNLVEYSVYANVIYASKLCGQNPGREEVLEILKKVHLENEIDSDIDHLSEGQKQRLAIICAVIKKPRILIMDEPTSALDRENAIGIYELMRELCTEGCTIIFTSHQLFSKEYADCIYHIEDQELICDLKCEDGLKIQKKTVHRNHMDSYIYYVRSFLSRYRFQNAVLIVVYAFMMAGFVFAIEYNDQIITNNLNSYGNMNDQEVLVESITDESCRDILEGSSYVYSFYPYEPLSVSIAGEDYPVYPLYPENDFSEYFSINYLFGDETGNYASHAAYVKLQWGSLKSELATFTVHGNTFQATIEIDGMLDDSITNTFEENGAFIMMDYQEYESLFTSNHEDMDEHSYIAFLNDTSELKKLKSELKGAATVRSLRQEKDSMATLYKAVRETKYNVIMIICLFIMIVIVVFFISYLNQRKMEFAILMMNGFNNTDLKTTLWLENVLQTVISSILGLVIFILVFNVFKLLNLITIYMKLSECFALLLLVMGILFVMKWLICSLYIHLLNKEQTLRD